ncbi:MAG TPA: ankyrin repeat domain-containing protein [Thermoanaerobaculia bacterium]|nr:ankyrin repeat domain-containing protein [Thermoanaerobaculia bacterium]
MTPIPAEDPLAVSLVAAIRAGDVAALQSLLDGDAELATSRIVDDRQCARTLLHIVADWPGHWPHGAQTVRLLAERGADVNARFSHPDRREVAETPLHWAASSDDVAVLDALLDAGADIEAGGAVFTGGTAMSDAVVFAQWNAARRLLERGAKTTFWQAAALGLVEEVRKSLLDVHPDGRDITNAFWHACRGGQHEVAELLLGHGADLHWIGYDRKRPLDVAEESGNGGLVAWLRAQGATAR